MLGDTKTINGMRYYETPNGFYPSVNTIISRTRCINKILGRKAERVKYDKTTLGSSEFGIERGNIVHSLAESFFNGCEVLDDMIPNIAVEYWEGLEPVLHNFSNIYPEQFCYSDSLRFAGTTDCYGVYDNKFSVIDIKTCFNMGFTKDLEKWFLQTYFYSVALDEMYGFDFEQLVVVVALPNTLAKVFVRDDLEFFNKILEVKCKEFWEKFPSLEETGLTEDWLFA